jgi:hypothetical protein
MRAGFGGLVLAVLLSAAVPRAGAQCAMCRSTLESSEEGRRLAVNLNRGILVLLGAPFGVAALVGASLYRNRRRLRAPPSSATFT